MKWLEARGGTLKGDFRYTGDTVFSTFPWPQNPTKTQIKNISLAVSKLIKLRKKTMSKNEWGLRELYNTLDDTGRNPFKEVHKKLDEAVREAYRMKKNEDVLEFLLNLNKELYAKERKGQEIAGPGLSPSVKNPKEFISKDCIKPSELLN